MMRRKERLLEGVRQVEKRCWPESETVALWLVGRCALQTGLSQLFQYQMSTDTLEVRKDADLPLLLIPYLSSQVLLI